MKNNITTHSLLSSTIETVTNMLKQADWNYLPGSIVKVTETEITIDSEYKNTALMQVLKSSYPNKKITSIGVIKDYNIDDFLKLDLPPRVNIINPWLPSKGLAMIYAPRGVGKTYLALQIALSVSTGCDCFNWTINEPRSVLYIDGEMSAEVLQERLNKMKHAKFSHRSDRKDFRILAKDLNSTIPFDLASSEFRAQIEKKLKNIELIIIDNISCCSNTKENDGEAWQPILEWALQMRIRGISVLFIHHAGKGGQQRGTSRREDALDTVIALHRPANYSPRDGAVFDLIYEKSRGFYGKEAESMQLTLNEIDDRLTWSSESIEMSTYKQVISLTQDGYAQYEIAQELNIHKSTVSRYLKRARCEGLLQDDTTKTKPKLCS